MDVLERVREVNAGASLTTEQISGARSRLVKGIDAGTAAAGLKRVSRRPMLLIAGAVAAAAAAVVTVVVVSQLTAPAPRVEAVPAPTVDPRQPGKVIPDPGATSGTGVTEPFPGTTPQAGQYISVVWTTDSLRFCDEHANVFSWPLSGSPEAISAAIYRSRGQHYVPADRTADSVTRFGPSQERVRLFGSDTEVMRETWDSLLPYESGVNEMSSPGDVSYLDSLPREPQAVLDYWWEFFSLAGDSREDSVLTEILSELEQNVAPADLRAAYLGALQRSGRSTVVSTNGHVVTYQVRFDDVDARTETISVDSSTGWVVESTTTYDRTTGHDLVPGDVPDLHTIYTVSIVDSIP